MELFATLIQIVNVISALSVIILVLLQHGKGADMGAAFGSGSAGSVFGSAGSANFLSRTTAACAAIFFATCLALVLISTPSKKADLGVMGEVQSQKADAAKVDASKVAASPVQQKKIPD